MKISNVSDASNRVETLGQGCRLTQLFPGGHPGDSMLVVDLLEIEPGGYTPLSAHAEEHVMFVLSGTGELSGAVERGSTVILRKDSVAHIGHREVHALRNTGTDTLRVLVSTPLVVRSERALGHSAHTEPEIERGRDAQPAPPAEVAEPALPSFMKEEKPHLAEAPPTPKVATNGSGAVSSASPTPAPEVEDAAQPPDISGLMKKASEIAAVPKSEKRKPAPLPEPEPEQQTDESAQAEEEEESQSSLMELLVVFDGGSRGNPGQGYGSYMVQSPNRKPVIKRVEFGDNYTNNQAEYDTLIESLQYIIERLEATNRSPDQVLLDIKSDSDLVVNQITGSFKVKDAGMKTRNAKALDLLERFGEWKIEWHPREESVKLLGH